MIQDFQNLIFSSTLDIPNIKRKIDEMKSNYSVQIIDRHIILAFSLNYEKIPLLLPFLSEPKMDQKQFTHFDNILLLHLLQNNISLPNFNLLSHLHKIDYQTYILEECLYEELKKQNKLDLLKGAKIEIRKKTKIEEIIEKDDIDYFRIISNDNNFDFNGKIKKVNELFKYTEIPILLYCIEKNAIKCFKYALMNGADPSQESIYKSLNGNWNKQQKWDGYGFAGAIGNIQIIKMIEDQGIEINKNIIKGSSKFHQNHIVYWAENEHKALLEYGLIESIKYYNLEVFNIIMKNYNISLIKNNDKNKIPLHYAAETNFVEIGEILISKAADIDAKDIIYSIMIVFF